MTTTLPDLDIDIDDFPPLPVSIYTVIGHTPDGDHAGPVDVTADTEDEAHDIARTLITAQLDTDQHVTLITAAVEPITA